MMRAFIPGLILIFMAAACGNFSLVKAPEIPNTVCSDYDKSASHIMKAASKYGIEINELYYGLLDAATVAMITDVVTQKAVKRYIEKIENFILEYGSLSYADLVLKMMVESDRALLLKNLLHRRIDIFSSDAPISEYDRCLILTGLENAKLELML